MERLELVQRFPWPLDEVLEARRKRYDDMKKFPELNNQKVLEEKEENGILYTRRELFLGSEIPDMIKKMVPQDMLRLTEEAEFNLKTHENNYKVFPQAHKGKLMITGRTVYRAESSECVREYNVTFEVNVPLVGGVLAGQIRNSYHKGIVRDFDRLNEIIGEKNGK